MLDPARFCAWHGCGVIVRSHRYCRRHRAEDERTKREALRKSMAK